MTDNLRQHIAEAMRKEFHDNPKATDDDATCVDWELMADVAIAELGRAYEDSLQSTAFAAIRLIEQHQTPRHFTEEAE